MTKTQNHNNSRRRFLKLTAGFIVFMPLSINGYVRKDSETGNKTRRLKIRNVHTQEKVDVVYWSNGLYQNDSLSIINYVLRDRRTNEIGCIDINLINYLHEVYHLCGGTGSIDIFCGHSSPVKKEISTPERQKNKSYHSMGMAVDFSIEGKPLSFVLTQVLKLKKGGVGYYPNSRFIHIDVGHVREWNSNA